MFKSLPTVKPGIQLLKSSERRKFLAKVQTNYPRICQLDPETVQQIVPDGLRQANLITSGGYKVIVYSAPDGTPLWFTSVTGPEASANMSNAKGGMGNSARSKGKQFNTEDIDESLVPTVYSLWVVPDLLTRLPTWPVVVDGSLLGGSALMVPGLLPPPDTFAVEGTSPIALPASGRLVAITPHPSPVPLVVARTEISGEDMLSLRAEGQKGKAARVLHYFGDRLWEMGPRTQPPSTMPLSDPSDTKSLHNLRAKVETMALADSEQMETVSESQINKTANVERDDNCLSGLRASDVDAILRLGLLQAISNMIGKDHKSFLPISAPSFYSAHVLPNRPTTWPPAPARSKKSKMVVNEGLVGEWTTSAETQVISSQDCDIKKSSFKKFPKWIKKMEKDGLLKSKELRGEVTITELNDKHSDVLSLAPFVTFYSIESAKPSAVLMSEHAADSAANSPIATTQIVVEQFWTASKRSRPFFEALDQNSMTLFNRTSIRRLLNDHITREDLVSPSNRAFVRPDGPLLSIMEGNEDMIKRETLLERLLDACQPSHRILRLTPSNARALQGGSESPNSSEQLELSECETRGSLVNGSYQPVRVDIKLRQGRKLVSLVTRLEEHGIDPKEFAAVIMKSVGTSTSVNPLPSSTPRNPHSEVFVQGDQRKIIAEMLMTQHGLDSKRHVEIIEGKRK